MRDSTNTEFIEQTLCWENTVLFLLSCYQYLILGIVYSKGKPYRQPIYTNGLLLVFVVLITGFTSLLVLHPPAFLSDIFEIEAYSIDQIDINKFRWTILLLPLMHLIFAYGIEVSRHDQFRFHKSDKH